MKGTRPPKTNGFSHGLNFHQILSYLLIITKIFSFGYFIISNFYKPFQIIFFLLYYPATLIVVIFGFLTTMSDPTDLVVNMERRSRITGEPFDSSKYEFHCEVCGTSVSNNTKHCRTCERCVDGFDHHCEWVNNCISKRNYKVFMVMILNLAISTFIFFLAGTLYAVDYYQGNLGLIEHRGLIKSEPGDKWHIVFIMIFSTINLVLFLLDMRLIVFHYFLWKYNMTTYEYIVKGREKQRERKSKKRSSLMLRGGKNLKQINQHDLEEARDLSLPDSENHAQKLKPSDKFQLIGNLAFAKLNHDGASSNDEALPSSKEFKNDNRSSNAGSSIFYVDKNLKTAERQESPNKKLSPYSYHAKFDYNFEAEKSKEQLIKGQESTDLPIQEKKTVLEHKLEFDSQLSSGRIPGRYPDSFSPTASARDSIQELAPHDPRDSKDFDSSPKGSQLVAVSLARIVNNYMPKYGKILEEENESERPNLSDATHCFSSKSV